MPWCNKSGKEHRQYRSRGSKKSSEYINTKQGGHIMSVIPVCKKCLRVISLSGYPTRTGVDMNDIPKSIRNKVKFKYCNICKTKENK